jgi:uncharacterized membrane protein YtjA (UPF0391 family)
MTQTTAVILFLLIAVIAANLPWLSDRVFFVFEPRGGVKRAWTRVAEWFVLYFVVGLIALGLEYQMTGTTHSQAWEFYVIGLCLFLVSALPGFIYRHDLKKHLDRARGHATPDA